MLKSLQPTTDKVKILVRDTEGELSEEPFTESGDA